MKISFSSNSKKRKVPEPTVYNWPFIYESIADVLADKDEERDKAEKAVLAKEKNFMCLAVKLKPLFDLKYKTKVNHNFGHYAEQDFFNSVRELAVPSISNRPFVLFPARVQGSGSLTLPSIVDFIALADDGNWFPVDFKVGNPSENDYVHFRNRYQALALYKAANRTLYTADRKIILRESKRHDGLIIRRQSVIGHNKGKKDVWYQNLCRVFVV